MALPEAGALLLGLGLLSLLVCGSAFVLNLVHRYKNESEVSTFLGLIYLERPIHPLTHDSIM